MSVTQPEDFMSLMVKSTSNTDAGSISVSKSSWRPSELTVSEQRTRGRRVDALNWRETLHRLVATYSLFNKDGRGSARHTDSRNQSMRIRTFSEGEPSKRTQRPTRKMHIKSTSYNRNYLDNNMRDTRGKFTSRKIMLGKFSNNITIGPEYSPTVRLCDILKLKPNYAKEMESPVLGKTQFLNYFGLDCNNAPRNAIHKPEQIKTASHPRNLVNCPHVPFSSDLGKKLIKDWHTIPPETHTRKLERLERYVRPNLFNVRHATDTQYEIIYNKYLDCNHTYNFPSKSYRRVGKFSHKTRFFLERFSKPCFVKLIRLEDMQLETFASLNKSKKINNQKENTEQKINLNLDVRVTLTDTCSKLKENASIYPSLPVSARPFSSNISSSKPFVLIPNLSLHPMVRLRSSVLQTLSPSNENSVTCSKKAVNMCENLINGSVTMSPINDFFGLQRSVPKSDTRSNELGMSGQAKHAKRSRINKVAKKRVNIYYPRRISPRLNIVASSSPFKVM